MTIDGTGHTVVVDGNRAVTVFTVNAGVTATLNALTIQHGNTPPATPAAASSTNGTLTVTNSTFSGNAANGGGGIITMADADGDEQHILR